MRSFLNIIYLLSAVGIPDGKLRGGGGRKGGKGYKKEKDGSPFSLSLLLSHCISRKKKY